MIEAGLVASLVLHLVLVFGQIPDLTGGSRCGGSDVDVKLCTDIQVQTEVTKKFFGVLELPVYWNGFNVEYVHYFLFGAELFFGLFAVQRQAF